jgi:hypothetical protein
MEAGHPRTDRRARSGHSELHVSFPDQSSLLYTELADGPRAHHTGVSRRQAPPMQFPISPVVVTTELADEPKSSHSKPGALSAHEENVRRLPDSPISPVVATTEPADEPKGSHSEYPVPYQHMMKCPTTSRLLAHIPSRRDYRTSR